MSSSLRTGAIDGLLLLLLGAGASLTHVGWYRAFEASTTVDAAGSIAVGGVLAAGHALVVRCGGSRGGSTDPRRTAIAFAGGVLLHASQAPAFTPFGLSPTGVNRVLFVGGVVVGLWSLWLRRSETVEAG